MPEIRRDPLTHRLVTLAPERADRPHDFPAHDTRAVATDVFTAGHEHLTPPEVYADRPEGLPANGPGWHVRVVPNRFPAVSLEPPLPEDFDSDLAALGTEGVSDRVCEHFPGFGAHEVVVECPDSNHVFHELPPEQLTRVLAAYRHRVQAYRHDGRFRYVQVFKNVGHKAGASVLHPHSQIVALPFVPHRIATKQAIADAYHQRGGRDLYESVAESELANGARVLLQDGDWLAFCPYASAFAFEVMILPQPGAGHRDLADFDAETLATLARVLHRCLFALAETGHLEEFNLALYQSAWPPPGEPPPASPLAWHLSILPRVSGIAGLELSTGLFINTTPPEAAADQLRRLLARKISSPVA
ncbi:MAG: DUF4921 family protein [Verrucomicrobiota bacterium]